jgi:hypothetical protein
MYDKEYAEKVKEAKPSMLVVQLKNDEQRQ